MLSYLYLLWSILSLSTGQIIPDAIRNGRVKPFKSYNDLLVWSFKIPPETINAVFKFYGTHSMEKCESYAIKICIQEGSYPVITASNNTYLKKYNLKKDYLYCFEVDTFYSPNKTAYVLSSPVPGNWFLSAYLSPDLDLDINSLSKVLYGTCKYSLASRVNWNTILNIPFLHFGDQVIKLKKGESFFKLLVPKGSTKLTFAVSSCTILNLNENKGNVCIESLSLRSKGLPHRNVPHYSNISTNQKLVFVDRAPLQTDSFYYLYTLSKREASINVAISIEFNPNFQEVLLRRHDGMEVFKSFYSVMYSRTPENFTLHSNKTAYFKFQIDPEKDIGSTLVIKVFASKSVHTCLVRSIRPDVLRCPDSNSIINETYVPYPEPGVWYLGVRSFEESEVGISIQTHPCDGIKNNSCGDYGVCFYYTENHLHLSACKCIFGFSGWTCEDDSKATFHQLYTSLLALSNLAFLPPLILAFYYKLWTQSLAYGLTMFFSTLYHICDEEYLFKSLLPPFEYICSEFFQEREVLQFSDFYSAVLSFWITIISLAKIPLQWVNFLNLLGGVLIAILVQYDRTGPIVFALPILFSCFILLISLIKKGYDKGNPLKPNRHCLLLIIPGIFLSMLGVTVFALIDIPRIYPYTHSTWHITIALSLMFIVPLCAESKKSLTFKKENSLNSPENGFVQSNL